MTKKQYIKLEAPIQVGGLNELQQKYANGEPIFIEKTDISYICPHCGSSHSNNYKMLNNSFVCVKCYQIYSTPREKKQVYNHPDVFNSTNKITIETPDWIK